jgi:asparagine synthase (glutamine-hydrolysing)
MSALAGICKFDPREPVGADELTALAKGIDYVGPDVHGDFIDGHFGMVHRALFTTPQDHKETQPLIRHGCALTWDGRLDNRDELMNACGVHPTETVSDAEVVLNAYKKWGYEVFAMLEGDWALAIYDYDTHGLVLARDYIGVRKLFYRLDDCQVSWCSVVEPLVCNGKQSLHLDMAYLAGFIYPLPPIESTPYREIRSLVPGTFMLFKQGVGHSTSRYWSLNPNARVTYATDYEYEDHFRFLFRRAVQRRLRADRCVLAELSGGVDSSSIVCMADLIAHECGTSPVETLSYFDEEEVGGDERPYFTCIEALRGKKGHHIPVAELAKRRRAGTHNQPSDSFFAAPGYTDRTRKWEETISEIQRQTGSRVILSGLGGDELLGGVQYEATELAEYLRSGRITEFSRSTLNWAVARKKTVYSLCSETYELFRANSDPDRLVRFRDDLVPWMILRPRARHTELASFSSWKRLSPTGLTIEYARYSLGQQLSATDPPRIGSVEKRYPYLDKALFTFLGAIPRTQVLQCKCRRYLMRRALRGIVPEEILHRKTKWFGHRASITSALEEVEEANAYFNDEWVSDRLLVDKRGMKTRWAELQHGHVAEGRALRAALCMERWLRVLVDQGVVDREELAAACRAQAAAFIS